MKLSVRGWDSSLRVERFNIEFRDLSRSVLEMMTEDLNATCFHNLELLRDMSLKGTCLVLGFSGNDFVDCAFSISDLPWEKYKRMREECNVFYLVENILINEGVKWL